MYTDELYMLIGVIALFIAVVLGIFLGIQGNNHVTDSKQKTYRTCITQHYAVNDCKSLVK